MSTYTTELRFLVENHFDLNLKDYPIFDENYRYVLNDKIIKHFYFREIGVETAELFKFYLNRTLNEIMPYYNQLYKSELLEFNPFYNVDRTEKFDRINTGNNKNLNETTTNTTDAVSSKNTTTSTANELSNENRNNLHEDITNTDNKGKSVSSDTPQGLLAIDSIDDEVYATTADYNKNNTDVKNNGKSSDIVNSNTETVSDSINNLTSTNRNNGKSTGVNEGVFNNTETYLSNVIGKSEGETYSEMLMKYRETFLNIDMMVISELNDLFMNIY